MTYRSPRCRFGLRILCAVISISLANGSAVLAAETTQQTEAPTQTTTVGTGTTTTPLAATSEDNSDSLIAGAVLVFGGAALLMTLLYLNAWRRASEKLAGAALKRTGALPTYDFNPVELNMGARGIGEGDAKLKIRGPASIFVGQPATFSALQDDAEVEAKWTIDPASAGTIDPQQGKATQLTATTDGPLKVLASVGDAKPAEAHVTALKPPSGAGSVPIVGIGYGGLMIATVAITVAGAMTALGVLDGAALAALLGTVVGYFFVERRTQGQESAAAGAGGTGDAAPHGRSTS